jgi:hypothetical protein
LFTGFQNLFSDLQIEIYQDEPMTMMSQPLPVVAKSANSPSNLPATESSAVGANARDGEERERKQPVITIASHKMVVSWLSKNFFKMLTSGLREGCESTIRLTTAYPNSLRKLLLSFYDHVLEIGSVEELVEMLYLADEYDVPHVMEACDELSSLLSWAPRFYPLKAFLLLCWK